MTTVQPRTPEHNPHERLSDQPLWERIKWWFWWGRGYRDVWLLVITGLTALALVSIQGQRADAIRDSCHDSNGNNIQTKKELRALVNAMPDGPRKKEAKDRQAGTELLIDALQPVRDCDRRVREVVGDSFL